MAEKVTLAEAKALGFDSTAGITKEGGMYKFSESLAPDRGGFQSVGVAKAGQPQMTPYFGDVTGAYRLTQEQYGAAGMTNGVMNTQNLLNAMAENEKKAGILPPINSETIFSIWGFPVTNSILTVWLIIMIVFLINKYL